MNTLACRACRKPLTSAEMCGICEPIKKNLVVDGEDQVALAQVSMEAVNALRQQIREYRNQLQSPGCKDREGVNAHVRQCAQAISKILDTARKLQKDGVAAVELMSFDERADLFISWISTLPHQLRNKLTARLARIETELSIPVPMSGGFAGLGEN